jgi:DNA-directed RNA polymerase specialized sigma subunit
MTDAYEHSGGGAARRQGVNVDDVDRDQSLEAAARDEREYARERLSAELGREPSDEEVDKWLSEQTEGY